MRHASATYRIRSHGRTITVVLPVKLLRRIWPGLVDVCRFYGVPSELLLAVALVETALRGNQDPHHLSPLSRMARRRLMADQAPVALTLELAACHLACQLERFCSLAMALVAYHTDPDWLEDTGYALMDDPLWTCYVERVTAVLAWLCRTRPWRAWEVPS